MVEIYNALNSRKKLHIDRPHGRAMEFFVSACRKYVGINDDAVCDKET